VFKLHWSKKMFQAEVAERIYVSIVTQLLDWFWSTVNICLSVLPVLCYL
jgi:hypothetical protein